MSDQIDSKRVVRAIVRAARDAKEMLASKDREIAVAKSDTLHWRMKYERLQEQVDGVLWITATPAYERGPDYWCCEAILDRKAAKLTGDTRKLVLFIAEKLARDLTERGVL